MLNPSMVDIARGNVVRDPGRDAARAAAMAQSAGQASGAVRTPAAERRRLSQERAARLDRDRSAGEALAHLVEHIENTDGQPDRMDLIRERGDALQAQGLPAEVARAVATAHTSQEALSVLRTAAAGHHIELIGKPGRSGGGFDRARHAPVGGDITPGEQVTVIRPEVVWTDPKTGERLQIARAVVVPSGGTLDNSRVPLQASSMTETTSHIGPVPKVTGYVKGREIRPGMVINAADLLPMHEKQGATTGENPNPRGHQRWIRVGMIGNSNTPGFKEYEGQGTLTGGMYIVVDQNGRAVGRMSANTIAETSTDVPIEPKAQINQVRMPIKIKVRNKVTGEDEIRDSVTVVGVPSKHAQEELGLPEPQFLREGVLDPKDPNYGLNGSRPKGIKQPFGPRVEGARSREEAAADRTRRREIYASGEEERARRLAEEKAAKKAEAAAEEAKRREESDRKMADYREEQRRKFLRTRHQAMTEIIAAGGREEHDWETRQDTFNTDVNGLIRKELKRNRGAINDLARAYGVKWRGKSEDEKIDAVIAAVRAGKTPNEEIDAPQVKAPVSETAKASAAEQRRNAGIKKNFERLRDLLVKGDHREARFHLDFSMSDNATAQLAESFGLQGLSGSALREALFEAIREGQTPNIDLGALELLSTDELKARAKRLVDVPLSGRSRQELIDLIRGNTPRGRMPGGA
ncbi:MAG TPA: hypothetical protein VF516_04765 [Kofleriaceae bacterium]